MQLGPFAACSHSGLRRRSHTLSEPAGGDKLSTCSPGKQGGKHAVPRGSSAQHPTSSCSRKTTWHSSEAQERRSPAWPQRTHMLIRGPAPSCPHPGHGLTTLGQDRQTVCLKRGQPGACGEDVSNQSTSGFSDHV